MNGNDTNDGMETSIILFDIQEKKGKKINSFDYTSQYPLGIYSKTDDCEYYSAGDDNISGDQLFSYHISDNKVERLTDSLFAINYILPRKEDIILVCVKKGTRPLALASYDKKRKELKFINEDDDINIECIGFDNSNGEKYYTAEYSEKEDSENLDNFNTRKVKSHVAPVHSIYEYDNNKKTLVYKTDNKMISAITANENFVLWKEYNESFLGPFKLKMLNLETKDIEEINIDGIGTVSELSLNPQNTGFYFSGVLEGEEKRGIYYYDLNTKIIEEAIKQGQNEFINNFMMMKSS